MAGFRRLGGITRGRAKRTASAQSVGGRAAAQTQFRLHGLKELQQQLDKLPDQLRERALKNASAAGARVIRNEAKSLAPVRTGNLRDSIVVSRTFKQKGKRRKLRGAVVVGLEGSARYYGHLVEFGSSKQAPQPFMRRALNRTVRPALDAMAEKLEKEVRKAIDKLPSWHAKKALRDVKSARRMLKRGRG